MIRAIVALFLVTGGSLSAAPAIQKITFTSAGRSRVYYLFVPERPSATAMPLIVTLHGSGRDGRILVEHWRALAEQHGIVLAGPDAIERDTWRSPIDGPDFLRDVVDDVKQKASIDPRRMYLFGHSAGAVFGLYMGMLQSNYFAAVAIHAGAISAQSDTIVNYATRKIPIWMCVGTNDQFFPLTDVRATRDVLQRAGIRVELWEIPRHTHDYYSSSREINKRAWDFLSNARLEKDPQYAQYAQ